MPWTRIQRWVVVALAASVVPGIPAAAPATSAHQSRGQMFERVVLTLETRFYDERVRDEVPELAARFREEAQSAASLHAERDVISRMLAEIPASHLGLLSVAAHEQVMRNLACEAAPTLGLELVRLESGFFVSSVLEGGPAETAGILRGDRVLAIDGVAPADSPRLDWRSDDAALPDPPQHALLCEANQRVTVSLERTPGQTVQATIVAREFSAYQAAKHSASVVAVGEHRVAFIHFWFVHSRGMDATLDRLIRNEFKDADALVLDLRGRGGNAQMVSRVLKVLAGRTSRWKRPIVALIDASTRSAKEMLAWELKERRLALLVGQTTAGALLPAMFAPVGGQTMLMFPGFAINKYTEAIEGKGIEPDVQAESPLPYSAGADPIRDAGLIHAARLAAEFAQRRDGIAQPLH